MLLAKVERFISDNSLLHLDDSIHLVALSGGADSVCLLLMLKRLGYNVEAIHCNFHLRGDESDRDESFCRSFCEKEEIKFHIVHFDTITYSRLHHVSVEMAARELRYSYFERLKSDINAVDICVAHHRDDSVETLLMNLVRGTGIHGLQGIKPRNNSIVRPLLCLSRKEIEAWLEINNQDYVVDSTNLENDVVRNRFRLDIIPLLADINPSVSENIYRTALRMIEAGKVFDNAIKADVDNVTDFVVCSGVKLQIVDLEKLSSVSSIEYVLFTILSPLHFAPLQIEDVAHADFSQSGKQWRSSSHILVVDRSKLLICPIGAFKNVDMRFPETGTYVISENSIKSCKLSLQKIVIDDGFVISKSSDCVCLDADNLQFPLFLRNVRKGDKFIPFGMKGSKLISDYLTDKKKNFFEKKTQMVLVDAADRVLWLVGERPDARCCITKNTINSLVVRYYCE